MSFAKLQETIKHDSYKSDSVPMTSRQALFLEQFQDVVDVRVLGQDPLTRLGLNLVHKVAHTRTEIVCYEL